MSDTKDFIREDFKIQNTVMAYRRVKSILKDVLDYDDVMLIDSDNDEELKVFTATIVAEIADAGKLEDFIDAGFINVNDNKRLISDNMSMEVVTQLAFDFFTSTGKSLIKSIMIKKQELSKANSMDTEVINQIVNQMIDRQAMEDIE